MLQAHYDIFATSSCLLLSTSCLHFRCQAQKDVWLIPAGGNRTRQGTTRRKAARVSDRCFHIVLDQERLASKCLWPLIKRHVVALFLRLPWLKSFCV